METDIAEPIIDEGSLPAEQPQEESASLLSDVMEYKAVIEALIFASDEPITFRQLKEVIIPSTQAPASEVAEQEGEESDAPIEVVEAAPRSRKRTNRFTVNLVRQCVEEINREYEQTARPFRIVEVAGGFSFQTTKEYGVFIGRMFSERSKRRLTQSALETLAIIAYKQPVSKPAIEAIRGVNADYVLKSLLEKDLIAIVGRDDSVGRPLLYGTTSYFLKHFGLRSLEDLPKPREIQDLLSEEAEAAALMEGSARESDDFADASSESEHLFDTVKDTPVLHSDNSASPLYHHQVNTINTESIVELDMNDTTDTLSSSDEDVHAINASIEDLDTEDSFDDDDDFDDEDDFDEELDEEELDEEFEDESDFDEDMDDLEEDLDEEEEEEDL